MCQLNYSSCVFTQNHKLWGFHVTHILTKCINNLCQSQHAIIKDISLSSNSGLSTTKLTEERIFSRTTGFISKISQTFFKQANAFEVKDLNELLRFVSKNGMDSIPQDALVKNNGYFTRFFSNESWQDWCENKTPLGKVVSLYCDCVTSTTTLKAFMDRIDEKLLLVANQMQRFF